MPHSNPLTPPSGEPVPDPLFDIAVTRDPQDAAYPPTHTSTPEAHGNHTRTLPPDGDPDTHTWGGTDPAAGHVRLHLPGYEILGLLGRGGMGVVYKARQVKLNRVVALKLMLHADHASPTTRERFTTEAQAVARMQHPNIVQVFEVGEVDGVPFFSLEYVPGGTLAARVAEHLLPPRDAATLVATLAGAVQYAHEQGIIHRDLKPTNILLAGDRGQETGDRKHKQPSTGSSLSPACCPLSPVPCPLTPKIADFGLAKSIAEDSGITRSGSVVGTPSYMPPEQAAGDVAAVGPPADIYALGAVLYELLAGRPPFKGANVADTLSLVRSAEPTPPGSLQAGVPRDLETICLKCLQKEPARRYATAGDLAADIGRFLRGEPILARPVGAAERAWRWCRRNPGVAGLLGTVAALLALSAVGATVAALRINEKRKEAAFHRNVAETRLRVYQKAVDGFVNEAPSIIEGHPLGAAPLRDLIELGGKLLRDVGDTADDNGLAKRGEMSSVLRQAQLARVEGRVTEAEQLFAKGRTMADELLRTSTPEEKGKNHGNLALLMGQQAAVIRTRAELQAGLNDTPKARELFAEAVKQHDESIALFRRVADESDMRDIHPGEALCWLGGALFEKAETLRQSAAALPEAEKPAAWEASRLAAAEAEGHFAAGLGTGWNERAMDRTRLRQAFASWERAKAADALKQPAEADEAYTRSFDLFKAAVRERPKNMLLRGEFSRLASERGDFLIFKMHDPKRALEAYAAAAEQAQRLGMPSELSRYADAVGANLYRMGVAALGTGDPVKARDYFALSTTNRQVMLREAVRVSNETSLYTLYPRLRLMFAQARAGDHAAAAAVAAQVRKDYAKDAARLNFATQGFALCALATDSSDEEAGYLDAAFEALERALDAGYADDAEMVNDPHYSALRADPRFPPLLDRARGNAAAKK